MMHNPVFESSMKRRMRSYRAPLLVTLYGLFLLLVSANAIISLQRDAVTLSNLRGGVETYIYLSIMQFALIVLVAPALTAGSISGERERQTLDLLLCTRVGALRIVLGKLFSSVCFLALMIVSSLPVLAIMFYFGGVGIVDVLVMVLFLLVTALACCSIGIFCSAVFKRTVTATVVSYLILFALGIGTIIVPLLFQTTQLSDLVNNTYMTTSSGYGISTSVSSTVTMLQAIGSVPKLLFINPAVGLFSLLVEQTGLLQRTFEELMGYRGGYVYQLMDSIGSISGINMIVLTVCSAILVGLSTIFVKPSGRKVKKKK